MSHKFKGLTNEQVNASRTEHGTNELVKIKGRGLLKRFFENLSDPIIKILIAALVINLIFTFRNADIVETIGTKFHFSERKRHAF